MASKARPTIRRPTTLFERPGPWIGLFAFIAVLLLVVAFLGIRALQDDLSRSATWWLIALVGLIALVLIAVTFFYSARKRSLQEKLGGTMMSWFKSHIWLGLVALIGALAHAALYPFSGNLSTGKITTILLVLLVASGIAWRAVYGSTPRKVPGDVGNLSLIDTRGRSDRLAIEIEKVKVGKSDAFQAAVDDLATHRRSPGEIEHYLRGLDQNEVQAWDRAKDLAMELERERARAVRQRKYARFMQGWRAVHLPLAALLLGALVFHLGDVFNVGRAFAGEPEKTFASSEDCSTCHSDIVDEWKLSMHRDAQTSTITRAQTPVTLAEQPGFGKACVNCHAPAGVKFTQTAVFPLFEPDPVNDPQGVENEGVTCVICHTRAEPPDEGEGASDTLTIGERGHLDFGTMFGPPLDDPIPNSAHDIETGFMGDDQSSSQMCAACHNVIVDVDPNDGNAPVEVSPDADQNDSDGDGVLDENDLGDRDDLLVLQTTYDEWEDYVSRLGDDASSCVDCHMPAAEPGEIASAPPALGGQDRERNLHSFVGVDYDMNASYYTQPGMPDDGMELVLEEREALLRSTVELTVDVGAPDAGGNVDATVNLRNLTGHSFPSGFAFARQWWIEISAATASGQEVCLADVETPDGILVESPCASGVIEDVAEELRACDLTTTTLDNSDAAVKGFDGDVLLNEKSLSPLDDCDPWLTNLQKILTDGDADGDGVLEEVEYQSFTPDIVRLRTRVVDDDTTDEFPQTILKQLDPEETRSFTYTFDASQLGGEAIDVTATMRMRHSPPYFVQSFDERGTFAGGLNSEDLLANMTIVDIASNKELPAEVTTPPASEFSNERLVASGRVAPPDKPGRSEGSPLGGAPILAALLMIPLAVGIRKGLRYEP
ncbi:MAG: multiheme c-type cytochrome [Actinomycetota bacterium]